MAVVPTYNEHECPLCAKQRGHCADCKSAIQNFDHGVSKDKRYRHMSGNGFQSCTFTHNHFRSVKGSTGIQPVKRELCAECYLTDFEKMYPSAELPFEREIIR